MKPPRKYLARRAKNVAGNWPGAPFSWRTLAWQPGALYIITWWIADSVPKDVNSRFLSHTHTHFDSVHLQCLAGHFLLLVIFAAEANRARVLLVATKPGVKIFKDCVRQHKHRCLQHGVFHMNRMASQGSTGGWSGSGTRCHVWRWKTSLWRIWIRRLRLE